MQNKVITTNRVMANILWSMRHMEKYQWQSTLADFFSIAIVPWLIGLEQKCQSALNPHRKPNLQVQ